MKYYHFIMTTVYLYLIVGFYFSLNMCLRHSYIFLAGTVINLFIKFYKYWNVINKKKCFGH